MRYERLTKYDAPGHRVFGATIAVWLAPAQAAQAQGAAGPDTISPWTTWSLSPEIVLLSALVLLIYGRGIVRRKRTHQPPSKLRHSLFFTGFAAIFLALQSPIDAMAERLFAMHQIQHILLRMLGPILIALASPQAVLMAGLPRAFRRRLLAPVARFSPLHLLFGALSRPIVIFALFVASLYVWQIPIVHNAALLGPALHYLMHVTMLAAGLLFWWLIFEHRDAPAGISHPVRMLMLVGVVVSNILIGALTTLKEVVLYSAYDIEGRLFAIDALVDETTGGYIIWVPASMMTLIAALIVVRRWAKQEDRMFARRNVWSSSNAAALEYPQTAQELRLKVKHPNRAAARTLAATSASMFIIAMTTAVVITYLL